MTLKEFSTAHQVSVGALSSWESGASPITEKNIHKIISLLAAEGLICSKEWLLEGTGPSPYLYSSQAQEDKKKQPFDLTGQFVFFKEIESFKKAHPEMLITLVRDDAMHPFLRVGDYVGGSPLTEENSAKGDGHICIVEVKEGDFLVRQVFGQGDKTLLLCTNPESKNNFLLLEETPLKIAPVVFMRRS